MTTSAVPPRPDLVPLLVSRGFLTEAQVEQARKRGGEGNRFVEVAVGLGLITEDQIHFAVSAETGLPFLHLTPDMVDPELIGRFTAGSLVHHGVVPLLEDAAELSVAMVDPWDEAAFDVLAKSTDKALNVSLAARGNVSEVLRSVLGRDTAEAEATAVAIEDTTGIALVYQQLLAASAEGADQIHFDSTSAALLVRFRLHGRLTSRAALPGPMALSVFTRLKVLAGVDPFQHGAYRRERVRSQLGGKDYDLTFAYVPSDSGGSALLSLALARTDGAPRSLSDVLGDADMAEALLADLGRPGSLVGLGVPPGLLAARELAPALLAAAVASGRKVVAIGAAACPGVLTLADTPDAIAHAVGLAPDVLHVGAAAGLADAARAALTGVSVTLELGYRRAADVVTHLLSSEQRVAAAACLRAAVALRPVRLLCPTCRVAVDPASPEGQAALAGLEEATAATAAGGWKRAPGCDACQNTGHAGQAVLAERLAISARARGALREGRLGEALALSARQGPEGSWLAEGRIGIEEVD